MTFFILRAACTVLYNKVFQPHTSAALLPSLQVSAKPFSGAKAEHPFGQWEMVLPFKSFWLSLDHSFHVLPVHWHAFLFFSLLGYHWQNCNIFKVYTWWFDTHCERVTTTELTHSSPHFLCENTLSNFQLYNIVLLAAVTILYTRPHSSYNWMCTFLPASPHSIFPNLGINLCPLKQGLLEMLWIHKAFSHSFHHTAFTATQSKKVKLGELLKIA